MQYRLSTLLVAFVVVWASLACSAWRGHCRGGNPACDRGRGSQAGGEEVSAAGWIAFPVGFFLLALLLPAIHTLWMGSGGPRP